MAKLTATKSFVYATRRLLPGEDFITKTERDARLLVAMGKARHAEGGDPALVTHARVDDLTTLRAEYLALLGKKPFNGWDAATLTAKIAEASKP